MTTTCYLYCTPCCYTTQYQEIIPWRTVNPYLNVAVGIILLVFWRHQQERSRQIKNDRLDTYWNSILSNSSPEHASWMQYLLANIFMEVRFISLSHEHMTQRTCKHNQHWSPEPRNASAVAAHQVPHVTQRLCVNFYSSNSQIPASH